MNKEEIKHELLTNEDFVINEVRKLQYLYGLKKEIRYKQNRHEQDKTESVAEHIWGMHVCAHYFLELETTPDTIDTAKIFSMITWHDIDEIEIGDIVSYEKITNHSIDEHAIQLIVISESPDSLQPAITKVLDEYEIRTSYESRFVKAIDKIEGYIEMYQPGYEKILQSFGRHSSQSEIVIGQFVRDFPIINRFYEVLNKRLTDENYFIG